MGTLLLLSCSPGTPHPETAPPPGRSGEPEDPSAEIAPLPREVGAAAAGELVEVEPPPPPPPVPWEMTPEIEGRVEHWIRVFREGIGEDMALYLERMGRYRDHVWREVEARGLPRILRYLPIIESGYSPVAVSRARAVGMWQFMAGTARLRGLEVSPLVDERRDPFVATGAALDYLVELRDRYDSWLLALSAYNGGGNRVDRLLRRRAPGRPPADSLYWRIRSRLPRETREYVPKLIAAARIAERPEAHGFRVQPEAPIRFDEVEVPDATSLDVVAEAAEADQEEIEALNPHYPRGLTPVGRRSTLRVPRGRGPTFTANYARIPPDRRVTFLEHRIRAGETLSHLAALYRVRVSELMAANPGIRPRRLQIGQRLIVPKGGRRGSRVLASGRASPEASSGGTRRARRTGRVRPGEVEHVVRRGDTLWKIARSYGVGLTELRRWNELEGTEIIRPGQRLRVRDPRVLVYRVQPGDTLSDIAARHGVSTTDLARFNGLGLRDLIHPGDEVRIPAGR